MNSRSIANFFRVASLLALLMAVGLLSAITTMHFAIHGAEVQVPSLKGMTVAQARSETAGLGLNLNVDNRYYSGEVAAGHILTQSPPPGTVVRREWRVRVAESLGPQQVDVPETVGREEHMAELELRRAGLEVGSTAYLPDAAAAPGTVLAQDPPAHAQDIAQPSVNLLVAMPDPEVAAGYIMPDLTGWSPAAAQAAIAQAGLKAAPLHYVNVPVAPIGMGYAPPRPPVRPGAVAAQSPAVGARVDRSTTITLVIAR
jgi:beta-lactam-binding protein with PASTA domain